jgi:RsiW-degrading membrane proteinase PrsW (M82 family)
MSIPTCCVCNTPIEGPVKMLGGRAFCERHYGRVGRNRRGVWTATLALVVGLVLFVLAMLALSRTAALDGLQGNGRLIVGVVMALAPALVWLAVFYLQDQVEPEPKSYLLAVMIGGALMASAIGQPLINNVFRVNEWASGSLLLRLVGGIFVIGAVQEFLKYAAVRYAIFNSPEFDERVDGIIYGAAAGLGYATLVNIAYVVENGGVDLGVGAIRVAVTALAHASFAGVTGYFLGRAKFENRGPFWLPIGVFIAALLNGVVNAIIGEITRSGLRATPLNGLIGAAIVAVLTFGVLFAVLQRSNRMTRLAQ